MSNQSNTSKNRESFGSRLGFLLVSAGCAVGLGNVWKFPYICGKNGGAAFILIYLIFLTILGFPILMSEFAIGRGSQLSIGGALSKLESKGSKWHIYRFFGFAGNYLLMMFYTMVAGWMLHFVYLTASGKLIGSTTDISDKFNEMLASPGTMVFWTILVIVACIGVCALGLQNGVERVSKIMMILLFILLVIMAVHSVTLKGAGEGLKFYLVPDFNRMMEQGIGNVMFDAMTHAFFTLSVGIGSMEIFGSYLKKDQKLTNEAVNVVCLDTFVALLAGLIIIPACFACGLEPDVGPSLLFVTLPNVFNQMAGGRIWGTLFFVFMSFAALSTVIAVFENIISMAEDIFHISHKKSLIINLIGISIFSLPAVFGFNLLSGFTPLGAGTSVMDLEDFLVSYNVLPLGSLLFVLFCSTKNGWGFENFRKEVNTGKGFSLPKFFGPYMRFVLPAILVIVYFKGYFDTFKSKSLPVFLLWMSIATLLVAGVFFLAFARSRKTQGEK